MIFSSMLHIPLENKIGEKTIQYNNQIKVECGEGRPAVIEHKKEKDKDQVIKKLKKLLRKNQKSADKKEYSHRLINNSRYNTICRLFKIQGFFVYINPEAEAQRSYAHVL